MANSTLCKPCVVDHLLRLDALSGDLSSVLSGTSAVISCVGIAPGGANMKDGNSKANVRAAKAAGIDKFVYLGLASELVSSPIKFIFGDYVKGKAEAEAAIAKDFGALALVIKPGIIAGGPPGTRGAATRPSWHDARPRCGGRSGGRGRGARREEWQD